jgi:hypothetical protein
MRRKSRDSLGGASTLVDALRNVGTLLDSGDLGRQRVSHIVQLSMRLTILTLAALLSQPVITAYPEAKPRFFKAGLELQLA